MGMVLIYITSPSRQKSREMASHLISRRLIACANIFEMESIYRWKGDVANEPEFVLLAKSTEDKYEEIKSEIESVHPYDVPCIIRIPVEANKEYLGWVLGEL